MSEKLFELGIPPSDITPAVSIAVNGLLEHIEHLHSELRNAASQLDDIQHLVDFSVSPSLPNRKSLIKRINWSIAMYQRHKEPICVVIFRIKNFHEVQRSFGTEATNMMVVTVAELLKNRLRDTDYFGRVSEADFGAIMYFSDLASCRQKAQLLADELGSHTMRWNRDYVTAEIDFGTHMISDADDAEKALLAATNSLFVTKAKTEHTDLET